MNIKEYQDWTATTVKYDREAEGNYVAYGLVSEVGELMGALAKYHRGDYSIQEYKKRAKAELGDICWFIARYASHSGWDLESLLLQNVEKLEKRKRLGTIKGDGEGSRANES